MIQRVWLIGTSGALFVAGSALAVGAGFTAVPIRDHFCTRAGPTCQRPEIALIVAAPRAGAISGTLARRPLRRPRHGSFRRDGAVRLRVPAGRSRKAFTRRVDGSRIATGDYRLVLREPGGRETVVRFFVRPS